ncbi:MAG: hypothetical protein WCI17_12230 [bacterium]
MRYWWANQKRTYDVEVPGGYLWCRQRRANGTRNPFYENTRMVAPGDVIFGYHDAGIRAIGMALSRARASAPPAAALATGVAPDVPGWLLDVAWLELKRPLHPGRYMGILGALLPDQHAPLSPGGKGLQGGRLLEIPDRLARALLQLAGGTDPAGLVNPDWQPHQLRFGFAEQDESCPRAASGGLPPLQQGGAGET